MERGQHVRVEDVGLSHGSLCRERERVRDSKYQTIRPIPYTNTAGVGVAMMTFYLLVENIPSIDRADRLMDEHFHLMPFGDGWLSIHDVWRDDGEFGV